MNGLNKAILVGEVVGNVEIKDVGNGLAKLRVKTVEEFITKDGEHKSFAEFHNVDLWGKRAQDLDGLTEGCVVVVDGRIKTRSYDKDGEKRRVTYINANDVRLMSDAKSGGSSSGDDEDF